MSVAMSKNEQLCFQAAMKWQRRQLTHTLAYALLPKLPYIEHVRWQPMFSKLLYSAVILALVPLLSLLWTLRCALLLMLFPYRYGQTWAKPRDLKGPGERNLQGVHNAFSRHINLSAKNYMHCMNEWITILYGREAGEKHSMEQYVNIGNLEQPLKKFAQMPYAEVRNILATARENLSRKLGYY